MGLLNALEEITRDKLLHFSEVVDGVGTFGCPVEDKRIKKRRKRRNYTQTQT